jgi:hypothetical protein
MRIAFALLLVITACKSKSSDKTPDQTATPIGGRPTVGEGSAPTGPQKETPIGKKDIFAQAATITFGTDAGVPPSDLPPSLDHGSGSGSAKGPRGTITIASKTSFDRTDLSADAVAEKITRDHLAALGNCYRATLARDAKIAGKATLAWTVKLDGAITSAKATAPDATLQSCFAQAMQTWTFPVPKNQDKEPTDAAFQVALTLAPE